jgi:hypothetical protein
VRLACAAVAAVAAASWLGTEGHMDPLKNARACAFKALRADAHTQTRARALDGPVRWPLCPREAPSAAVDDPKNALGMPKGEV